MVIKLDKFYGIINIGVDPMENLELIYESENIYYVKVSEYLLEEYLKMYNDIEIQKLLFKKVFNKEQIESWVNKLIHDKNIHIYSMIEKETNEYIGNFEIIIKKDNVGEILLSIIPEKQNRHYGTESIKAMINYATKEFNINEFELYVKSDNSRAIHCYEKIGFITSGSMLAEEDIHMNYKNNNIG